MSTAVAVREELTIVTPLGVKFRDESTRAQVSDELDVVVYPAGLPELRRDGVANRAGVFVFRNLPGLHEVESGSGDDEFWALHPPHFDFVLEVSDRAGRFLPYAYPLQLPVRRPLTLPASLPGGDDAMPLFSAPARTPVEAMGVIRAEVVDSAGAAAAWAVVDATTDLRTVRGMADARGQLMLAVPYPRPRPTLPSPLQTGAAAQTWDVDLAIRYAPRSFIPPRPDLAEALRLPIAATIRATLRFGQELRLAPLTI